MKRKYVYTYVGQAVCFINTNDDFFTITKYYETSCLENAKEAFRLEVESEFASQGRVTDVRVYELVGAAKRVG